ncbi:Uncharacterised protein [Neisseria flavescens]|uniref:Uncharacterized protein n=1 Tax=Neisseria flavescens NRL30031/H210 TaxID=546264 RepID=C0EKZ4_NEIFL|nr:hypothetical protein NEIFLAOT_00597 [Neisseria flavescens NRL30031/H210]SPY03109.1 Uncharacterised protein [Neisseria meningitidis]SPY10280.1 Uncharacterised protein [Neisseria meningitidis]STZ65121.1 Uncharacterised protein [Neisseria flavescens]
MQVDVAVVGIDFNVIAGRYIRACGGRRSVIGFVDADRAIDVRNGNTGFNIGRVLGLRCIGNDGSGISLRPLRACKR